MNYIRPTLAALVAAIGVVSVTECSYASTVDYTALGNYLLSTTYTTSPSTTATRLPAGFSVELGTFTSGFNFTANTNSYTGTNSGFTLYNTTTIGSGGAPVGEFAATTGNLDGFNATGTQLYIWVFNNATPANATAWAIVTNTTWTVPALGTNGNAQIDTSDANTFVPTGAKGALVADTSAPSGLNQSIRLSAVPEPSSYALGLLGCLGLLAVAKRRMASVA